MEVKFNKKTITILTILLFITISISVVGASYAYFRAIVESNNVSSMTVTTSYLQITYTETKNIVGNNISPGWSDTKIFTVKNTGSSPVTYNMLWKEVTNTLINKQYLKYSIVGTGTGAFSTDSPVIFPSSDEIVESNISIDPDITHNYILTINYIDDPEFDQSEDMNKEFAAIIAIESN